MAVPDPNPFAPDEIPVHVEPPAPVPKIIVSAGLLHNGDVIVGGPLPPEAFGKTITNLNPRLNGGRPEIQINLRDGSTHFASAFARFTIFRVG